MTEQNTAITPYENYKKIVNYANSPEVMDIFAQVLGREAPHYVQSAIMAVKMNERLMECTPRSIFNAALRAATLRLSCDPSLGHAFLVPYKNKGIAEASFQPGWKGIQHMALRTGKYDYINVSDLWNGEEVEEDRITGDIHIVGEPKHPKVSIGLIASFRLLAGLKKSIYMSNEELEAHGAKYSKSYSRSDSIWKTNKRVAYHKTIVLKLLRNYGYISPLEASILSEDEQSEISDLNMPKIEDVTIIEKPKLSKAEINRSLGLDDDEEIIDGKSVDDIPEFVVQPESEVVVEQVKSNGNKWARPMPPEVLKEALQIKSAKANPATDKQINLTRVLLLEHFADREDERHQAQEYLTGHKSFKDIEPEMISAILDWMKPEKATDGSGAYVLGKDAKVELTMVARKFMEDLGQQALAI
jgi:recombination protein RecT